MFIDNNINQLNYVMVKCGVQEKVKWQYEFYITRNHTGLVHAF
jgi:Ser-tRNA(Ala) deacylase AlaX